MNQHKEIEDRIKVMQKKLGRWLYDYNDWRRYLAWDLRNMRVVEPLSWLSGISAFVGLIVEIAIVGPSHDPFWVFLTTVCALMLGAPLVISIGVGPRTLRAREAYQNSVFQHNLFCCARTIHERCEGMLFEVRVMYADDSLPKEFLDELKEQEEEVYRLLAEAECLGVEWYKKQRLLST